MSDQPGTVELLAIELSSALQPLEARLASGEVVTLFAEMGLQFPPNLSISPAFSNALASAVTVAGQLPTLITDLIDAIEQDDIGKIAQALIDLLKAVQALISAIRTIATELEQLANSLAGMNPADVVAFAQQLPERLVEFMVLSYLEAYHPIFLSILSFLGIAEITAENSNSTDPTKPPFTRKQLVLSRISDFFNSPAEALRSIYKWGDPDFDGRLFLERFHDLLFALDIPAKLDRPTTAGGTSALSIFWFQLKPKIDISPPGLEASLELALEDGVQVSIPFFFAGWTLEFETRGHIDAGQSVILQPPANFNIPTPTSQVGGELMLRLVGEPQDPSRPFVIFGQAAGSRLQARRVKAGVGASFTWNVASNSVQGDIQLEAAIEQGKIVIALKDADSFIAKLLPEEGIQFDFDLKVGWSEKHGLYFAGSAGLEIALSLHLSLGPFTIDTLYLALNVATSALRLEVSISSGGTLGPLEIAIDRIGVLGELKYQQGNLGPLDAAVHFKPPNGLGILVDAGEVTGGGYIFFDVDKGEYAGTLELKLETIQIKVIALLDTRLPDGTPGFSFLFIVSVEFTPIQLGFGFSLNGVGGLAGINRDMLLDVLRAGLRNHTLNSILFPEDPVGHAQQLISDLRSVFPPVDGRYVFGPMLEIAWGGFILVAKLGVILELPSPIRLAILGQITAALPTQDEALIIIHMDVLGAIDFEKKALSIDATLYDSRIVIFTLQGDMALRLTWGDNPNFALALGGFFPGFKPPPGFPQLHRLMVSVSYANFVQLSLSTYMAFTSNSVQFGANLELKVDLDVIRIHGYFGFDALFIFSPFSFVAHMQAGVDLEVGGLSLLSIRLDVTLSGPTPWHIQGTASIDILFFSISVHVDEKFGDDTQVTLPQINVLPQLLDALNNPQNWHGSLPGGAEIAVSLAKIEVDDKTILVQPLGLLTVRQTVVPLGVQIAKFNNAAPADADRFDIGGVTIGGKSETQAEVDEYFASGQFFALSDADKVSAPSYTSMKAGVQVGSEDLHYGRRSNLELRYETRIVDDLDVPGRRVGLYAMPLATMLAANHIGAAELSLVRGTGNAKYVVPGTVSAVSTSDPTYVVASTTDLTVHPGLSNAGGAPYFVARAALATHLAAHPEDADKFQVLPLHEAVTT